MRSFISTTTMASHHLQPKAEVQKPFFSQAHTPRQEAVRPGVASTMTSFFKPAIQAKHDDRSPQASTVNTQAARKRSLSSENEDPQQAIPRKIGDGHDLKSAAFSKNKTLEAVYDNEITMQKGSQGKAVELLQQALIDQGHPLPKYGVDGQFGYETLRAVLAFQAKEQLSVDGIVGTNTIERLDAANVAGNAKQVANCCADSKTAGLDNGDVAGVICCDGAKHACLWISGGATGATDAKAVSIIDHCGLVHEYAHFDDVDCPAGAAANRPPFKAGKVAADEEKKSYKVEQKCLESLIGECGGSDTCKKQVRAELKHVKANT